MLQNPKKHWDNPLDTGRKLNIPKTFRGHPGHLLNALHKQLSRGVLRKKCSENMQQIYKRTPMPKCDFNKLALQLYWNRTLAWVFSCKFAAYFQNTFSQELLWMAASGLLIYILCPGGNKKTCIKWTNRNSWHKFLFSLLQFTNVSSISFCFKISF